MAGWSRLHANFPILTVDLLPCQALNVNDPLLAVDSDDLALAALHGNITWMHEPLITPLNWCLVKLTLKVPRTTETSSSLRTGRAFTCARQHRARDS